MTIKQEKLKNNYNMQAIKFIYAKENIQCVLKMISTTDI